jgi:hypothetical protein
MTKQRNSFLDPNFSLEDVNAGLYGRRSGTKSNFNIVNKMGLLAPLADIHNTDPMNFAMEAARCLGESDVYGAFVTQGLSSINHTYETLINVKQKYGIEGLNVYTFGQEGIGDLLEKAKNAIIMAFKKIVQALSNFIKSIANFVGSQIAKFQEGTHTKYTENLAEINKVGTGKAKKIKAPAKLLKETEIATEFKNLDIWITKLSKSFETTSDRIMKSVVTVNEFNEDTGQLYSHQTDTTGEEVAKEIRAANDSDDDFKKVGSTSAQGKMNENFFGAAKPILTQQEPKAIIEKVGISILTKTSLKDVQDLVKGSKELIKAMNVAIKASIKVFSDASKEARVSKQKAEAKKQKKNRKLMKSLTSQRNYGGYATGMVLSAFSCYLRTRGYVNAADKSLISKANKGSDDDK